MVLLLHAAQPLSGMGSGVLRVRLLDDGSVSPASVSSTENTKNPGVQPADISIGEGQPLGDVSQSTLQDINGYLPVSALSERPELLKDIDPEWLMSMAM